LPKTPVLALAFAIGCAPTAGGATADLRPTDVDSSEMWRFAPTETVESFDSPDGNVRVFYTRAGVNAVPTPDTDGSGVPDTVELVAATYEEALAHYVSLGYRAPVSDLGTPGGDGGDDRFDVYLVDFALRADGSYRRERCTGSICSGYMVQENDFVGYRYPNYTIATRILASHELFHAVQAAYDADGSSNFGEATAVWATESFDPSLDDFEGFVAGWMRQPERSLDQEPLSPADGYSYGVSIFFRYLSERFGDDVVLEIWEAMEDGAGGIADPVWLPTVASVIESHDADFIEVFHTFSRWILYSGIGGPAGETFAEAASYAPVTRVTEALPFHDDALRVFTASTRIWSFPAAGRTSITAALVSDDPAETATLELTIAIRRRTEMEVHVITALEVIDATGADEIVVAVSNGNIDGNSARPGLCVGTPAEVTACASVVPDAGVIDTDAGIIESDASIGGDVSPPSSGCSCRAGSDRSPPWPLGLLGLALLRRRRQGHSPRAT
jgi:MYXO-CTERM domain-containing protein